MKKFQSQVQAPFIHTADSVTKIMLDVLISLAPCLVMAYLAFGFAPFLVIASCIGGAVGAEFLFSWFFLGDRYSVYNLSAIVTGLLLSFTLAPFTPWFIALFGGAMAVIFGKLLWGGLGCNALNPALVGREFMTVFFPVIMTGALIWKGQINMEAVQLFSIFGDSDTITELNKLYFHPSGAIGEYSPVFLALGGLYLLFRKRINWHVPVAAFAVFAALLILCAQFPFQFSILDNWQVSTSYLKHFSIGAVLLGTVFMATDMPTSPASGAGRIFYGAMLALTAIVFLLCGLVHEYMSFSILLVNGFARPVSAYFVPKVWARKTNYKRRFVAAISLGGAMLFISACVVLLHKFDLLQYIVYAFLATLIIWFSIVKMPSSRKTDS